jgi:hypothetical protein
VSTQLQLKIIKIKNNSTVARLLAGRPMKCGTVLSSGKRYFLPKHKTRSVAHHASYSRCTTCYSLGVKQLRFDSNNSHTYRVNVINEW